LEKNNGIVKIYTLKNNQENSVFIIRILDNNKFQWQMPHYCNNIPNINELTDLLDQCLKNRETRQMSKRQQTATELSRTLSGQWTKTEKRAEASRQITASRASAHAKIKAFKQTQLLNK
jgi:arsenate reductase-like glutaredoxin family protein